MATATKKKKRPAVPADAEKPSLARMGLAESDFNALRYVGETFAHLTESAALRFCIVQQAGRDGLDPKTKDGLLVSRLLNGTSVAAYQAVADEVRKGLGFVARGSSEFGDEAVQLRQWTCWLYADHVAKLKDIGKRWSLDSRVDAVRLCIRVQARLAGFNPPGGVWN